MPNKFKRWFKSLFYGNIKYIVWHKQARYAVEWIDKGYTSQDNFNYTIYCYPYRLRNKYKLLCTPEYIKFIYNKKYATQHEFYSIAVDKLRSLEKSSLIEHLIEEEL